MSVLPVVKIDNYNISNGKPGDVTKQIMDLYNNYINKKKLLSIKELKIAWIILFQNLYLKQFFSIGIIP